MSRHINDVISSSTEEDEDNQRHNKNRNSENANIIANNKNAVNVRKGSLSSINSRNIAQSNNSQMSPPTSQTKSISKLGGKIGSQLRLLEHAAWRDEVWASVSGYKLNHFSN